MSNYIEIREKVTERLKSYGASDSLTEAQNSRVVSCITDWLLQLVVDYGMDTQVSGDDQTKIEAVIETYLIDQGTPLGLACETAEELTGQILEVITQEDNNAQ